MPRKSYTVFYAKVALLAIGVALVIGVALCSPTTPTSPYVIITTASTPMTISGPETGGAPVHVGGISVFALHENQYVFAWVSITGDNNFSFSGMMNDINPGGPCIRSGEPIPYTPPAIAFAGLFPGAYTVDVVYGGISCPANFVLSPDTTVTVTVIF
jgi:hypothetical protein